MVVEYNNSAKRNIPADRGSNAQLKLDFRLAPKFQYHLISPHQLISHASNASTSGHDTATQRQATSKYAGAPATAASLEMRQQMPRQRKEPRCQRTARRDRRSPRQNGQPKKRPSRPSARSGPQVPRNAIKIYASESRKDQLNCSCRDTRLESYMLLVQATGTSRHTTDASGIRMQT
jgi:hypothetical protein